MENNILEVKDLKKSYKEFTLNNLSFKLEKGYIMGFIGPNGAGKSTTIKLIMNLINRDGGEISVFGLDNIKDERCIKQRIGFVYDENHFYDELSITEMKGIIAPFYKGWSDKDFERYLKDFDLPPRKKIKELSKGMKTKFSLAVALSHDADFIIMDEPTSGLDPVFRSEILDILASFIQDEKKAVLFSTHITTDLEKIADYITFINNGELVFSETKDSILENYALVKGGKELLDDGVRRELVGIRENNYGFEAVTSDVKKFRSQFKGDIIIEKPTLEDIMLYTVRGSKNA